MHRFEFFNYPLGFGLAAENDGQPALRREPKRKAVSASFSEVNSSCQPSKWTVKPDGVIRRPTVNPD
jgi:hypothetical protein